MNVNNALNFRKVSKSMLSAAVALVAIGMSSSAFGALLVDFKPDPILNSSGVDPAEIQLVQSGATRSLTQGPGATGNGDGVAAVLNPSLQTAGGLIIQTPVALPLLTPGAVVSATGTTVYDVSLRFDSGWDLNGSAVTNTIVPGITVVSQALNSGRFSLLATDGTTVLLTGTISSAVINGLAGQTTGSVQSTTVTYDGGLIKNAITGGTLSGSLSWSLLDVGSGLSVDSGQLAPFSANMTGLFSTPAIPEPATMGLFGLAAAGALARRRNRKA
jgi:hypothetical protein